MQISDQGPKGFVGRAGCRLQKRRGLLRRECLHLTARLTGKVNEVSGISYELLPFHRWASADRKTALVYRTVRALNPRSSISQPLRHDRPPVSVTVGEPLVAALANSLGFPSHRRYGDIL